MVMRKIQIVMASILVAGTALMGFAQESDRKKEERERQENLNREMTLEREYDPIVQDATKVSTLPAIREMNITKRPITYSDYTIPLLPNKEMNTLPPGKLKTDIPHAKRNGYLHFGGGMSTNLMGDFGYHLLNTERDRLGVYVSHRSTNGYVAFEDSLKMNKRKAQFNDNLGGIDYKHQFNAATLSLGGKFGYSMFNYYGRPTNRIERYPLSSSFVAPYNEDSTTNQAHRLINAYGRVSSDFPYALGYHLGIEYTNFNQKYALSKDHQGMTENHLGIDFGLRSVVKNDNSFGVNVKANVLSYSAPDPESTISLDSAAFRTHVNATLNPYYRINREGLKLLIGANLMLVSQNDEINVYASPQITLDVPFSIWNVFYTHLRGGIESNTMAELSRINRYINPAFTADASKTWADLKLGVRSSATTGLWFDIFAGYKYTESDVFFNPSSFIWINSGFNNVSTIFQPTSQRIQGGITIKYDFQKTIDFYLKGVYDHYILKYNETWKNSYSGYGLNDKSELKPYGKPAFTGNVGINVRPVKPLTLNLDYGMIYGLYAYVQSEVNMKDIHDLRFRASWKFNDMFSLYAQCNNLLFQKQSYFYGYPMQPFTAMAGFNINF